MSETNYALRRLKLLRHSKEGYISIYKKKGRGDLAAEYKNVVTQLEEAISKLEGDGWIETAERLPFKKDANEEGKVYAWSTAEYNCFVPFDYVRDRPQLYPFWMPLPQPPKQDQ